jgi:hypothetical protein
VIINIAQPTKNIGEPIKNIGEPIWKETYYINEKLIEILSK